jgi:hypothetical protein
VIAILQYLLALGALANNAHNSYQLCTRLVFAFAPETEFAPILFVALPIVVHLGGAWALYLRVGYAAKAPGLRVFQFGQEFTPCRFQPRTKIRFHNESFLFWIVSWLTALGFVLYIIYATFMFSGALFITLNSALMVAARILGSILVYRAVMMYELCGLSDRTDVSLLGGDKAEGDEATGTGESQDHIPFISLAH